MGIRFRERRRTIPPILLFCLACVSGQNLEAQVPYSTGSGSTSISGYYDGSGPASKAPTLPTSSLSQPVLPTVPLSDYLSYKSALLPYVTPEFTSPPRLETTPPPVLPRAPGAPPLAAVPNPAWEGIADTGKQPPSPDIAVGPADVVVVVNSAIAQYTRAGELKKTTAFFDWFASVMPTICPSGVGQCLIFDPVVRYDQLHGRFLFLAAARDFNQRLSYLVLSVSNGATYDSGWKIWALDPRVNAGVLTDTWADFWRVGFDNVAVYLGGNLFNQGSNSFLYGKIRVIKKSDLYNPATTTLNFTDAWNLKNEDGSTASSLTPAHPRGNPATANAGFFVNAPDKVPASFLTVWTLADPLAAQLTLTRTKVTGLAPYLYPAPAPQAGGRAMLDSGDSRILKVVYRSGFLYVARDAGYTDAPTTVTVDVINTATMTLASESRLLNANVFYPAFDVPATIPSGAALSNDNIVAGTTTAADGSLTFAGISKLKAGEGYYDFTGVGALNRWGDYFGGAIDPVSGGMWTYGEYAKAAIPGNFGHWGTWAGYFPWSTTNVFSDVDPASPYANFINVLNLWQITTGCSVSPARFCPANQITRGQMAVFLVRAMFGDTFDFTHAPYFTDVPAADPFFPYIQKMRDLGITTGCTAATFCPENPTTRWQAAVFLIRAKMAALFGDHFSHAATPFFTDVPATAPEFPFVQKLFEMGITTGCTTTSFCPNQVVTRQQMAVFVTRAFLN